MTSLGYDKSGRGQSGAFIDLANSDAASPPLTPNEYYFPPQSFLPRPSCSDVFCCRGRIRHLIQLTQTPCSMLDSSDSVDLIDQFSEEHLRYHGFREYPKNCQNKPRRTVLRRDQSSNN
jgi:hypothetical protein